MSNGEPMGSMPGSDGIAESTGARPSGDDTAPPVEHGPTCKCPPCYYSDDEPFTGTLSGAAAGSRAGDTARGPDRVPAQWKVMADWDTVVGSFETRGVAEHWRNRVREGHHPNAYVEPSWAPSRVPAAPPVDAVALVAAALDESISDFVAQRDSGEFDANPRDAARIAVEALAAAGWLAGSDAAGLRAAGDALAEGTTGLLSALSGRMCPASATARGAEALRVLDGWRSAAGSPTTGEQAQPLLGRAALIPSIESALFQNTVHESREHPDRYPVETGLRERLQAWAGRTEADDETGGA